MRVILAVLMGVVMGVLVAVLFVLIGMHSLMVMTLLFLCAAQQAHSLRRFHGNHFFIGKPRQNV